MKKKKNVFTSALALGIACTTAISSSIVMPAGAIADDISYYGESTVTVTDCHDGDTIVSYDVDGSIYDSIIYKSGASNELKVVGDSTYNRRVNTEVTTPSEGCSIKYVCLENTTTEQVIYQKATECGQPISFIGSYSNNIADTVAVYEGSKKRELRDETCKKVYSVEDYDELTSDIYYISSFVCCYNGDIEIDSKFLVSDFSDKSLESKNEYPVIELKMSIPNLPDLNYDGLFNSSDIILMQDYVLNKTPLSNIQYWFFYSDYPGYDDEESLGYCIDSYNELLNIVPSPDDRLYEKYNTSFEPLAKEEIIGRISSFDGTNMYWTGLCVLDSFVSENNIFTLDIYCKDLIPLAGSFQLEYDPSLMVIESCNTDNLSIPEYPVEGIKLFNTYNDTDNGILSCYFTSTSGMLTEYSDYIEGGTILRFNCKLTDKAKTGDIIPVKINTIDRPSNNWRNALNDSDYTTIYHYVSGHSGNVIVNDHTSSTHITKIKGDANFDGNVSVADVIAISSYVGNPESNPLDAYAIANGDVHNPGDGISSGDALMIQQYLAGIIPMLDVE